ncbi:MAG: NUDIX hydrolase [Bdellovibrionales bacterium]|nr:NUDIX hydrolase [Bdellovibrionales bacterium]
MKEWKLLDRWQLFKNQFLRIRLDRCELPDGRVMPNYFVLDFADWVQVVALDEDDNMIMVRQYRHGTGETLLEIPGGSTDPGDTEEPILAAKRELLEETGYESSDWEQIGSHSPNPALMSNDMHVFLAKNCKKVAEQNLDPFEDLDVELVPAKSVLEMLEAGQFRHSLVATGLFLARSKVLAEIKS